jgi:hypothetical protein
MARIENHKYSVEEAFRECFYVVPDYQREYVWTEKEVHQLLQDIDEQIAGGSTREYFVGTVLVSPTTERSHFEVIDGQQRLTTFFLLLCALRHQFQDAPQHETIGGLISTSYTDNDGETRTSLKLEPRYENAGELMAELVVLNSDPQVVRAGIQSAGIPTFGSLENLLNAYSALYSYLKDNYDDGPRLKRYWGYLANNVVFIQISTDLSSALKIFETINERGIGLNPMDLLKNLLFTHVDSRQFAQLKNEWKHITKPLEQAKEKPLRFLRYFLMANFKITNERGDAVVREDEIYDWFVDKGNAELCNYAGKPFEFVRKVSRNVKHYLSFINGFGNDGNPNSTMDSLKLMCGGAFSLHHVLLLAASGLPKNLFDHFLAQLENFLFYYIFTKTPTRELERNFSVWADELRMIAALATSEAQRDALNAFVRDRLETGMASKEQELRDALRRYTLHTMQQYRTRYLLAKLTQHVDMAYRGLRTQGALSEYTRLEIEHILPNNPQEDLRRSFEALSQGTLYDDYKHRLGNLTLLEKPINIVAGNDFFDKKRAEYRKSRHYLTSSIAAINDVGQDTSISRINTKLQSFDEWSVTAIDERHEMLIGLALDVWKTQAVE